MSSDTAGVDPSASTPPIPTDEAAIMEVLRQVIDPELGTDIVELGMAKGAEVDANGLARITIALTTMGCPLRAQIRNDVRTHVEALPGITKAKIEWTELTQPEKAAAMAKARKRVAENPPETSVADSTRVIMVASGKGGVGKSSVTTNLATAIAELGFTVGVLDADIWGYSVPRMLGVDGRLEAHAAENARAGDDAKPGDDAEASTPRPRIIPNEKTVGDGLLKVVSMGFLVDQEETALMWRGLMLNRAVQHFLEDVEWGDLDYLLIDMPPGTGDVQMGLAKLLPRAEMLIVTTPASAAQKVAARAASMGRNNYLRIIGVIENMSAFVTPSGERFAIFGEGGGAELASQVRAPLLGQVPIDNAVAAGGDAGQPAVLVAGPASEALRSIAARMVTEIAPPLDLAACSAYTADSETAVSLSPKAS